MAAKVIRLQLEKGWHEAPREAGSRLIIQKKRKIADKYYSLNDLAKRFQCGYDLLYKAVRRQELVAEVVGKSYRTTEEAVVQYLDFCRARKRLG